MLNKKWLADQILSVNDNYYMRNHFYNLLYLITINRFTWKGLPKNIDADFIERELVNCGELAFIDHPTLGYQVCFCAGENVNLYGRPTKYLCWSANNEINDWFDADDIVIIRNNKLSETSHDFINRYASVIAEIQKTKEVNLNAQKTPILIACDESQLLTLKNFYAQYEGNSPVIYGTKAIDIKGVQVFKTDAPYLLDKLQTEKIENINECLTFMGINTVPRKKERMITQEADANIDMTNICLSIFLNPRVEARDQINEKFGKKGGFKAEIELAEYCKTDFEPKQEVQNNE